MNSATLTLTYEQLDRLYWKLTNKYGGPDPLYVHLWTRVATMLDTAKLDPMRTRKSYPVRFRTRQAAASWLLAISVR